MKEELTEEEIEYILAELKRLKKEHPKANVVYNTEKSRIIIFYPLPRDFWQIKNLTNKI